MKAFSCRFIRQGYSQVTRAGRSHIRLFSEAKENSEIFNPSGVVHVGQESKFSNPTSTYGRCIKRMLNSSQAMVAKEFGDLQSDDMFIKILVTIVV